MTMRILSVVLLCLPVALAQSAAAGEIELRGFYQARQPLIRLGNVASFTGIPDDQRRELEQLPLLPAPQQGLSRRVTAQEVRETMSLYGISLPTLRVTGECRVEGTAEAESTTQPMVRPVSLAVKDGPPEQSQSGTDRLNADLVAYLQTKDRIRTQWKVQSILTKAQSEVIAAIERPEISGGQAPWTGRQVFTVRDRNAAAGGKPTIIKADVERLAQAVVAKRNLAAGEVIASDDIVIDEISPLALSTTVILNLEDAVGKEVKRAIPSGQIMQTHMLQRPLVVKRGELITIYSLAAGVKIKATAKSLGDAALGDVLLLESSETKKQFQARVTGPQEAMVFVDTPKVTVDARPAKTEDRTAQRLR